MTDMRKTFRSNGMNFSRRQILKSAVAAGMAPALAGLWASSAFAAELTESEIAEAQGDVSVLVWEGYDLPDAFAAINKIALRAAYLAANEDTISKTVTPGAFDLLTIYQGMVDPLIKLNRIEPIDTKLLSNFEQLFPFFRESPALGRNGSFHALPYTWGTMKVLYDADKMDAPKSFEDLMAPALTGKVGVVDDAYAVITTFARYAGFNNADRLSMAELEKVMALLDRFKPQILSIAPSYGELPAMYARGEIIASVPDWAPTQVAAQKAGRNIQSVIPAEGAFTFIDSWMRVAGAKNPAAAYAVLNQAISKDAQIKIAASSGLGITNQAAAAELPEDVRTATGYDNLEENFKVAPIYPGVPIEKDGDIATYQDWLRAWTQFKAS